MKVDQRTSIDSQAAEAARRTSTDAGSVRRAGKEAPGGATDRVEMSPEASLLASALTASQETPAIRTELVDRAKAKLAAGKVGADAGALADSMLDDLLK